MFKDPYHPMARILVAYTGLIQLVHFGVLVRAALHFQNFSMLGFPVSPPPSGWQDQAVTLLLTTGAVDAANVVLFLLFVFAYFRRTWWWRPLAILALSIAIYSAILYVTCTVSAGAWQAHPLEYWSVAFVLAPVYGLSLLVLIWSTGRDFWRFKEKS